MKAYNDDPQLKRDMLAEVARHREADMLVKGTYGDEESGKWRGCAVGCSLHSLNAIRGCQFSTSDHEAYESIGVPVGLAYLQDRIFEGLPDQQSQDWPERFWDAIPVGADLRFVYGRWFAWTLLDDTIGFWKVWKNKEDQDAFKGFGQFLAYLADDKPFKKSEWNAVRKSFLDSLTSLDSLASLASLARLDSLDSLACLACLARLASLDRLDRLACLDRLARLDSLARLARLDRFASLARLARLDLYKIASDKLIELLQAP